MKCPRLVAEALPIPGGYGVIARLWATCRSLAAKLKVAMLRKATLDELCLMKSRLVGLTVQSTSALRCAWESIGARADWSAGLFAIQAACSPDACVDSVADAVAAFERLEAAEVRRSKEASEQAWHNWVAEALSEGAGRAHRWTKRDSATICNISAPDTQEPQEIVRHHTQVWAEQWRASDATKVEASFGAVMALRERALRGRALNRVRPARRPAPRSSPVSRMQRASVRGSPLIRARSLERPVSIDVTHFLGLARSPMESINVQIGSNLLLRSLVSR